MISLGYELELPLPHLRPDSFRPSRPYSPRGKWILKKIGGGGMIEMYNIYPCIILNRINIGENLLVIFGNFFTFYFGLRLCPGFLADPDSLKKKNSDHHHWCSAVGFGTKSFWVPTTSHKKKNKTASLRLTRRRKRRIRHPSSTSQLCILFTTHR